MSEELRKPTALRSLSVLASNAKVEQLRAEFAADKSPGSGNVAMSSTNASNPTSPATATVGNETPSPQGTVAGSTDSSAPQPPSHSLIDRAVDSSKSPEQKALTEKIIDNIRKVYDPEIPINVYDLGLIYGIDIAEDRRVTIRMTLTAPGCPVAGMLVSEVERQTEAVDEVVSAKVELVWDPPWGRHCMSEAALLELGLL